jgi:hypothetical protein
MKLHFDVRRNVEGKVHIYTITCPVCHRSVAVTVSDELALTVQQLSNMREMIPRWEELWERIHPDGESDDVACWMVNVVEGAGGSPGDRPTSV